MTKKKPTLKIKSVDFNSLIGQTAKLYLTAPNVNTFQLGSILFECIENENDGYRSAMKEIKVLKDNAFTDKNKFLEEVSIESGDYGLYKLVGSDNHVWLIFGTIHSDSYYPSFIFNWTPKPLLEIIKLINKRK
jgi:hypothetical protein